MTNEFAFPATLTEGTEFKSVTAFNPNSDRPIYQASSNHPHWDAIIRGLKSGDPNVWTLFDVAGGVMVAFKQVTDRVSYDGSDVLWDGDPIHSVLADQLGRAIEDGNENAYTALAKFWEKLESNPSEHSRTQAYDWLAAHKFQITPGGDIVGYKGVTKTESGYLSTASSQVEGVPSAFVDGKPIKPMSKVPNPIGAVVTMPRSEVVEDPRQACRRGLHVATHGYAQSYGTVLEVHVNPRDIVSVPTDGAGEKVRACRYKVVRELPRDYVPTETALKSDEPQQWTGVGWSGSI